MSDAHEDRMLRELFQQLARQTARQAPPFQQLWETAHERRNTAARANRRNLVLASACTGALLVWAIRSGLPNVRQPAGDATPTTPISLWRSPTDFLLNVNSSENWLGKTIPSLNDITGRLTGRLP